MGSGRGDVLEHIEFQPVHAVIVTPRGTVPDKTRTMYGLIQQSDWTDGTQVAGLAAKLNDVGSRPAPRLVGQ
jgi:hypothetical protein